MYISDFFLPSMTILSMQLHRLSILWNFSAKFIYDDYY